MMGKSPSRDIFGLLKPINQRLKAIERRLDGIERRLDGIERTLDSIEGKAGGIEDHLGAAAVGAGVTLIADHRKPVSAEVAPHKERFTSYGCLLNLSMVNTSVFRKFTTFMGWQGNSKG